MEPKDLFKLHKLKIVSYSDPERATGQSSGEFEAMFNPASITIAYKNKFDTQQGLSTTGAEARYTGSTVDSVSLKLILDGTGVTDFGLDIWRGKGTASVTEQVKSFLDLCYHMKEDTHEPSFLKIQWGDSGGLLQNFECRLETVDITYTTFDQNGAPLRAELATKFIPDIETAKRLLMEGKSSPDLSHTRTVKSGDTLPLLCKAIYGTSKHYLRVAEINQLDNFRNLTPGQELIFPPLET